DCYATLRTVILSHSDALKIQNVKNIILAEAQIRAVAASSTAIALKAQMKGKNLGAKGTEKEKEKGKENEKGTKCDFCGRAGHDEEDCLKKKAMVSKIEAEFEAKYKDAKPVQSNNAIATIARLADDDDAYSRPPLRLF